MENLPGCPLLLTHVRILLHEVPRFAVALLKRDPFSANSNQAIYALSLDSGNNPIVAGSTVGGPYPSLGSTTFTGPGSGVAGFVAILSSENGTVTQGAFVGLGIDSTFAHQTIFAPNGRVYVTGTTTETNLTVRGLTRQASGGNTQGDMFVAELNEDLSPMIP